MIFNWRGIPLESKTPPDGRSKNKWYSDVNDNVSGYELEGITIVEGEPEEVIFYMDGEDSRTIAVLP